MQEKTGKPPIWDASLNDLVGLLVQAFYRLVVAPLDISTDWSIPQIVGFPFEHDHFACGSGTNQCMHAQTAIETNRFVGIHINQPK